MLTAKLDQLTHADLRILSRGSFKLNLSLKYSCANLFALSNLNLLKPQPAHPFSYPDF
jgi:hypothetical protein